MEKQILHLKYDDTLQEKLKIWPNHLKAQYMKITPICVRPIVGLHYKKNIKENEPAVTLGHNQKRPVHLHPL